MIGRLLICYASLLLTAAAAHAQGPAVSGPNGTVGIVGGEFADKEWARPSATFAAPLGHAFGAMVQGGGGVIAGEAAGESTLHLFTRDPSSYLLGLYTWYFYSEPFKDLRVAGEFEFYLDRFTLSSLVGLENADARTREDNARVVDSENANFFGVAHLTYYVTDNFKITAGYRYVHQLSLGSVNAEHLLASVCPYRSLPGETSVTAGFSASAGA